LKEKEKLFVEEVLTAIVIFVMFIITVVNVLARYVLKVPFGWSEEITMSLFVWATMLGASAACARNANLGFTLFADLIIPRKKRRIFDIFLQLMTVCFCGFIVWNGAKMVLSEIEYKQVTPIGRLPEWIFGISVPIGAAFFIFRTIQKVIRLVIRGREL
jgi:C4-dicarboxylate transporter DctQ subunit